MKKTLQKITLAASSALASMPLVATIVKAEPILPGGTSGESVPKGYFTNFADLISGILTVVIVIGALLVLLYLIWGGIDWITSGGDSGKTEKARNKITAAVIGLIILAASYAIFSLVTGFLKIDVNTLYGNISGS